MGSKGKSTNNYESDKITNQTNESINTCIRRIFDFTEKIDRQLPIDDVRHILSDIKRAVRMVEEISEDQSDLSKSMARLSRLCADIRGDIKNACGELGEDRLLSRLEEIEKRQKHIMEQLNVTKNK